MKDNAEAIFTWDYEKGAAARAQPPLREGQDVDVERRDRPAVGHRGRPGEGRRRQRHGQRRLRRRHRRDRHAARALGRARVARVRRRVPELDAQPVHARRAGRPDLHGQDRRDGAVDRRQVLRVDPGDGRGPPRRGVRQVPRHQAVGPLPDQRPPARCCSTTSSTTAGGT